VTVDAIRPVEDQPAAVDIGSIVIHSGKIVSDWQLDDEIAMQRYSGAGCYDQTSIFGFCESHYRARSRLRPARG